MPTYEYACSACGHEWEETQRIVDPPIDVCPKCSKGAAHRLISRGTGFILKGGGWYSDLYASPGAGGKKAEAGVAGSEAGGAKKEPPADAKPAAAESKPAAESKSASTEPKAPPKSTASTTP